MIACYDLARCPPTYDVVAFLALAELERLRRGEEYIDLHILPGPVGGFRRDSLWPQSVEERVQMRENVLVPLCHLLPSVREVHVAANRDVNGWGKQEYFISLQNIVKALGAGSRPLRVPAPIRAPKLITFTLREAEHHPLRNSRTEEWVAAAQTLMERGFDVIVIRDTVRAAQGLSDARISSMLSRHLFSRAALYARAALNVGISNGPMWLSIFMNAPTLMLRPTTNAAGGCYDDRFYAKCGVPHGSQLPESPPHQRLVWEEDYRDNIVRAVEGVLG